MADKRAYAKFDIGYLDNPKMMTVLDESPVAVIMHAASVMYAAQHLTDGHVPVRAMYRKAGGTPDDADLLIEAGLWHGPGHFCEECPEPDQRSIYVHNYLEHNRSEQEANKASQKAAFAAKAKHEQRKAAEEAAKHAPTDATEHAPKQNPSMPGSMLPSVPIEREKEREKEEPLTPVDSDESPEKPKEVEVVRGDVQRLCDHLRARIIELGSKKPRITKAWTDQARLMLDNDNRTEEEAHRLIDWCMTDGNFWQPHIGSMKKFREKYDTMRLQAKNKSSGPQQFRSAAERRYEAGANLVADELSELQRSLGELTQ